MTRRTIEEVYNAVLDVKGDVIDLKEHVNDRNEAIERHIISLERTIDGKLSNDQLFTSLGFQLLNSAAVRWSLGIVATATVGTVAVREWLGPFWGNVISRLLQALS